MYLATYDTILLQKFLYGYFFWQKNGFNQFKTGFGSILTSVTIFGSLSWIWLLLTPFCYKNFFMATFLAKKWFLTSFKLVLALSLCALM